MFNLKFNSAKPSLLAVAIGTALGTSPMLHAQTGTEAAIEEVVVTGSRGRPRTVTDSPVPVDVFSTSDIEAVSYTDTNNLYCSYAYFYFILFIFFIKRKKLPA